MKNSEVENVMQHQEITCVWKGLARDRQETLDAKVDRRRLFLAGSAAMVGAAATVRPSSAAAHDGQHEALERRIQKLEDIEAILKLKHQYAAYCDELVR